MKPSLTLRTAIRRTRVQLAPARALPTSPSPSPSSARVPPTPCRLLSTSAPTRATTASKSIYTAGASCPSCGTPFPRALNPLCPSCSALLPPPPPSTTYFALFGLEPTYAIDTRALKRSFLELQQKVHPDMFSGKGDVEDWAKAWSGKVNDAYKALLNERERGEYLVRFLARLLVVTFLGGR